MASIFHYLALKFDTSLLQRARLLNLSPVASLKRLRTLGSLNLIPRRGGVMRWLHFMLSLVNLMANLHGNMKTIMAVQMSPRSFERAAWIEARKRS